MVKTRLISMVSNPNKVVVVGYGCCLGPKLLIPKQSMSKKIRTRSVGSKNNLGPKRVRSQKVLVQNIKVPKNVGPKNFGYKKSGVKNFVESNKFWLPKCWLK